MKAIETPQTSSPPRRRNLVAALLSTLALATTAGGRSTEPAPRQEPQASGQLLRADLDGDARAELLVVTPNHTLRVFARDAEGRRVETTASTGLDALRGVRSALVVDFDRDGDPDLFVVVPNGTSRLLANDGEGRFLDVSERLRLDRGAAVIEAEAIDFDEDGAVDLLLTTTVSRSLHRNSGEGFDEPGLPFGAHAPATRALTGPSFPSGGGSAAPAMGAGLSASAEVLAQLDPPFGACTPGLDDFANPGVCLRGSSQPSLGRLYPVSNEWYVSPSGAVGVGSLAPTANLDVAGGLRSRSGGLEFPDGTVLTSELAIGPTGATGPAGGVGPVGSSGGSGATGPAGAPGAVGAAGATGVTGSVGPVGSTGAAGSTGSLGAQGVPGATGARGPEGGWSDGVGTAHTSRSVGLGPLAPQGTLDVSITTPTTVIITDFSTNSANLDDTTPIWQSITAAGSGYVENVRCFMRNVGYQRTAQLTIHEGEGVSGQALASVSLPIPTGNKAWRTFNFESQNVWMDEGATYSFALVTIQPNQASVQWHYYYKVENDPYPGGKSSEQSFSQRWVDQKCRYRLHIQPVGPSLVVSDVGLGVAVGAPSATSQLDVRGTLQVRVPDETSWALRFANSQTSFVGGARISDNGFLDITNALSQSSGHARLDNNGNWSTTSDARLKREVEDLGDVLDDVLSLEPLAYRFLGQGSDVPRSIGFRAQAVQARFPSLVTPVEERLTLDYSGLNVVAIAATQEFATERRSEVDELHRGLDAFERRLAALERR